TPRQGAAGQIRNLPAEQLLDSLSVRLNGERAGTLEVALDLTFTDTGERFGLSVENAVLHHARDRAAPGATPTRLSRATLVAWVLGETDLAAALAGGEVESPRPDDLAALLAALDRFDFWFEIVLP
ncbi:MAG: alkyl sulfatase C-terminal domain-containing protein, partial [Phenylobacterium sp.]|nr:alkyl sulfatase C-terminal domain-containing protein [Phenylobacterium sp.]